MELQAGQYLGRVPLSRQLPGLMLTTSQHAPQTALPVHHHVNPYFTLVVSGHYTETVKGRRYTYQPGAVLFHPAQTEHSNTFAEVPAVCFNVELMQEGSERLGLDLNEVHHYGSLQEPRARRLLRDMLREARDPDPYSPLLLTGYALELAGLWQREQQASNGEPPHIRLVKTLLQDTLSTLPALTELSLATGVSPEYLCRDFKRRTGFTIGEYSRRLRVTRACQLLVEPRLSTEEIAFQLGFTDASHLNKVFQQVMGVSPTAYRQAL